MKAVVYHRYGGPEVLEYTDVPEPVIRKHQLLVRVRAASINPVDWKLRAGKPRIPFVRFPRVPGSDVSGEIVRVGTSVTGYQPGEEIYAMLSPFSGGACAELAAVPAKNAACKPRNLSFEEAAAVPLAGLAALQGLRDRGKIAAGKRVLVNGASGGVGSFAVQIARCFGAEVTGVTSGKNLDFAKALGANHVMDYTSEDFTSSEFRYDLIFDAVGNRTFGQCRSSLRPKGVYVSTLPTASTVFRMAVGPLGGGKQARVLNVRPRGKDLEQLAAWIEAEQVRPPIDRVLPLPKLADGHTHSESGHARGKIVIHMAE